MAPVKIFSGTNSRYLAEKIAQQFGKPLGSLTMQKFADGELCPVFTESVRGCDVYLIQSTNAPAENLMELLLMVDAARRASAKNVTVVTPYFGYARQDRKDKPRVSIAAKLVANLLNAAGTDGLMTCDLHAGQIQGFFDMPVHHLDGSYIFIPYIKTLRLNDLVFAAPDVGGTGRARAFAKHFAVDMVICDKYRKRANEIASMQVIGNVEGKDVVIIDDIIDTGGTLTKASDIILAEGAKSVRAICTHPLLSGNAFENIENSSLEEIVVTDTIPLKRDSAKIRVLTVSDLFAKGIRKTHNHESISSLFIQ
ncbi:ribose-phosphate pyrophosphokinase [Bacteroidota bacterium]